MLSERAKKRCRYVLTALVLCDVLLIYVIPLFFTFLIIEAFFDPAGLFFFVLLVLVIVLCTVFTLICIKKSDKRTITLIILLVLGLLLLYFDKHTYKKGLTAEDGLITRYGQYTTEEEGYIIDVSVIPETILKYTLKKPDGTVLIDSKNSTVKASVWHKWRLCWDSETEYLWVDSSDVGTSIWIKQADGSYTEKAFVYLEEPAEIPKALKLNPSASLKDLLERVGE